MMMAPPQQLLLDDAPPGAPSTSATYLPLPQLSPPPPQYSTSPRIQSPASPTRGNLRSPSRSPRKDGSPRRSERGSVEGTPRSQRGSRFARVSTNARNVGKAFKKKSKKGDKLSQSLPRIGASDPEALPNRPGTTSKLVHPPCLYRPVLGLQDKLEFSIDLNEMLPGGRAGGTDWHQLPLRDRLKLTHKCVDAVETSLKRMEPQFEKNRRVHFGLSERPRVNAFEDNPTEEDEYSQELKEFYRSSREELFSARVLSRQVSLKGPGKGGRRPKTTDPGPLEKAVSLPAFDPTFHGSRLEEEEQFRVDLHRFHRHRESAKKFLLERERSLREEMSRASGVPLEDSSAPDYDLAGEMEAVSGATTHRSSMSRDEDWHWESQPRIGKLM